LIDLGRFTEWYDDLPLDNVPVHDCMVFSCTAGLASSDTGLAANAGLTYVVASCKGTIENRVMGKIISVNTNQLRCLVQVRGMMTLPLFVTATAGDRGGLVIAATAADDSDWVCSSHSVGVHHNTTIPEKRSNYVCNRDYCTRNRPRT
jgi:hypothetical protein